jgi:UDP-3-O-[3-hydroxymyristoyl] glucosamine N-acyltransferase
MDPLGSSALPARPASEWAKVLGCVLEGPDVVVEFACTLESGAPGGISFLANPSYRRAWAKSAASVVLASTEVTIPEGFVGSILRVANPYAAWSTVLSSGQCHVAWAANRPAGVDPSAVVAPGVQLAEDVVVGPRSILNPGVVLYPGTVVGADCILHANVVLGSDGFGFVPPHSGAAGWTKIPHLGRVRIGDGVELGSGTCVDRAVVGETFIGNGSKLDNLCQIGHNVRIGAHCVLAGQVGVAGSSILEDYVVVGGQAGIAGHITIGRGSRIGAQSGVAKSLAPGSEVLGSPAVDAREFRRFFAAQKSGRD